MKLIHKMLFLTLILGWTLNPAYSETPLSDQRIGVGVASASRVTSTSTSLTSWFSLAKNHGVQTYLGLSSTQPVHFGIGGIYQYLLLGSLKTGVHIGGGIGLGNAGLALIAGDFFFVRVLGNAGAHFEFPGLRDFRFGFDAGPVFQIVGPEGFNASLGAFSSVLGLSVMYLFSP